MIHFIRFLILILKKKWNNKNLLIADEVGVGKTIEAGIIIKQYLYEHKDARVLIICPVKLCSNWKSEMHNLFGLSFDNYSKDKKRMHKMSEINNTSLLNTKLSIFPYSYFTSAVDKTEAEQEEAEKEAAAEIEDAITEDLKIMTEKDNPEGIANGKENNVSDEIIQKIKCLDYDVLIIDEAHYIRNRKSKLYTYISELINCNKDKMCIFMTATPVFNDSKDYEI